MELDYHDEEHPRVSPICPDDYGGDNDVRDEAGFEVQDGVKIPHDDLYWASLKRGRAEGYAKEARGTQRGENDPRSRAGFERGVREGRAAAIRDNGILLHGPETWEDGIYEHDLHDDSEKESDGRPDGNGDVAVEEESDEDPMYHDQGSDSEGSKDEEDLRHSGRIKGKQRNNKREDKGEKDKGSLRHSGRKRGNQRNKESEEENDEEPEGEDVNEGGSDEDEQMDDAPSENNDGDDDMDRDVQESEESEENEEEELYLHVRRCAGNAFGGKLHIEAGDEVVEWKMQREYAENPETRESELKKEEYVRRSRLIFDEDSRIQQYPSDKGYGSQALRFINCNMSKRHTNGGLYVHDIEFFVPNLKYFRKKGNEKAYKNEDWPTKRIAKHNDDNLNMVVERLRELVGHRNFRKLNQRNWNYTSGVEVLKTAGTGERRISTVRNRPGRTNQKDNKGAKKSVAADQESASDKDDEQDAEAHHACEEQVQDREENTNQHIAKSGKKKRQPTHGQIHPEKGKKPLRPAGETSQNNRRASNKKDRRRLEGFATGEGEIPDSDTDEEASNAEGPSYSKAGPSKKKDARKSTRGARS